MSTVTDLINEFNTKKQQYLLQAFASNRALRARYTEIANSLLNTLATRVQTVSAKQATIHKDIAYFDNLVTLADRKPPLPSLNYTGPLTTIAGKQVPQMPVFLFQTPVAEIETAATTALASIVLVQIAKDSPAIGADFENAFAKYYRFEVLSVGPGGDMPLGVNATLAPLTFSGAVQLSSASTFTFDQRILLTRTIKDANNNELLVVNNFIFTGTVPALLQPTTGTPVSAEVPIVLMRFEAIATPAGNIADFRGLRMINTTCRGSETAPGRVVGNIIVMRQSGYAGSIVCR